jgi:hypothetical protein
MTDELRNLIAELRAEQNVHGAIIKALVQVINNHLPELELNIQLQQVYAETLLHFKVTDLPNLTDYYEERFKSFGIGPGEPPAHNASE